MTKTRIINIGTLCGITESNSPRLRDDLSQLKCIQNAYLEMEDDLISGYGPMSALSEDVQVNTVDADGALVIPGFIDCHTHLVFAANREGEFVDRIKGLSYQEIAERGGGILNSAARLAEMSEDELFEDARKRLESLIRMGTCAIEIKSGYGLTLESEIKMLRVIRRLKEIAPIPVKATFLGAHAFPKQYAGNKEGYVEEIINKMLPAVAEDHLADYVDAFCEDGYFDVDQTERIVEAAAKFGMPARLHVNQFTSLGAVEMAIKQKAISVEHLEVMTDHDVELLSTGKLIAVALPACSFFLQIPYTPARRIINAGAPLVLASDFNPGSSPTGNLSFVWSLACIYMKMLPEEALNALTINAANALNIQNEAGSIAVGKKANFIISHEARSINEFPYRFGENLINEVYVNGKPFKSL